MTQGRTSTAGLIVWVCFVGFVTWLDWVGLFTIIIGNASLVIGHGAVFIWVVVLLLALRAVLGSAELPQYKRWLVALSIVWLLVLPAIPWSPEKALVIDATRLRPGMTVAQVQAIMATHQGVHTEDDGEFGFTFCADPDWNGSRCENGSIVVARMSGDALSTIDIDMD